MKQITKRKALTGSVGKWSRSSHNAVIPPVCSNIWPQNLKPWTKSEIPLRLILLRSSLARYFFFSVFYSMKKSVYVGRHSWTQYVNCNDENAHPSSPFWMVVKRLLATCLISPAIPALILFSDVFSFVWFNGTFQYQCWCVNGQFQ